MQPAPHSFPARRELWLAGGLAAAALLLLAPGPKVSPDSLELLASVRCWAGQGPCGGPTTWPPLWPGLLLPFAGPTLELAAWTINLLLAGAVALPLYAAARRLGGRWAARAAVLAWVLLPAVAQHAAILDPRPAMWLLTTMTLALGLRAAEEEGPWWPAFLCAALAPLARPEGVFLLPLVAAVALLARQGPARVAGLLLAACLPAALWAVASGEGRFGHELFGLSWHGVWTNADFLALTGPATAGTGFRELMEAAVRAGVESPPIDPRFALLILPHGLASLGRGLLGALGLLGLLGLGAGAARLWPRGWRARLALLLAATPLLALAALPMSWGQISPTANLLFTVPALLALAAAGWVRWLPRRRQALGLVAVAALLLELQLAPWGPEPPRYIEGSDASTRMSLWLAEHPPEHGRVACTYAGRGVVRAAGLEPVTLPSSWEPWRPEPPVPVLLAPDLLEDGGRGLMLLEDPAWVPSAWVGPVLGRSQGGDWYLYLEPASSS
jgi:hypothetical protein